MRCVASKRVTQNDIDSRMVVTAGKEVMQHSQDCGPEGPPATDIHTVFQSRASPLTATRSWSDMCMIAVQDEMSSLNNGARMEEPESCAFPTVCANSSNRGSQIRF